jgi:hypothetical protein
VVRDLVLLSIWSEVRFLTHVYRENLVEKEKPILCAPQVIRRRLVINNGNGIRTNNMLIKKNTQETTKNLSFFFTKKKSYL